jgi:hypothetical protein
VNCSASSVWLSYWMRSVAPATGAARRSSCRRAPDRGTGTAPRPRRGTPGSDVTGRGGTATGADRAARAGSSPSTAARRGSACGAPAEACARAARRSRRSDRTGRRGADDQAGIGKPAGGQKSCATGPGDEAFRVEQHVVDHHHLGAARQRHGAEDVGCGLKKRLLPSSQFMLAFSANRTKVGPGPTRSTSAACQSAPAPPASTRAPGRRLARRDAAAIDPGFGGAIDGKRDRLRGVSVVRGGDTRLALSSSCRSQVASP